MIRLPFTGTYSLELITAQNGAQVVVCYSDKTTTAYAGGTQATSITSATTTTICSTPAAATIRDIDEINIKNTYAGSHTVTVQLDANGTNYPLLVAALLTDESLNYTHGSGWQAKDANGNTKTSPLTAMTSAQLAAIVSDETGSGALVFANSPTLVTPALGTPSSGTLTNCTGLPIAGGGTGQTTAQDAINALTAVSAATNEYVLTKDTATGNAVFKAAAGGSGSGDFKADGSVAMTGDLQLGNNQIVFEGTADDYEITLDFADPTADRTITLPNATGTVALTSGIFSGLRNKIVNGCGWIDQQNINAAVTVNFTNNTFGPDKWSGFGQSTDGVFTLTGSKSVFYAGGKGFPSSIYCQTTTADASIGAAQSYGLRHAIEGQFCADWRLGTANAATVKLRFAVRSSLTGTHCVALKNNASDRTYVATYTISSADTWEEKEITIALDTTGTWLATNGAGIKLIWNLGAGSNYETTANTWVDGNYFSVTGGVNVIGTLNATLAITDVDMRLASDSAIYEFRDYQKELDLCQREYCKTFPMGTAPAQNAGNEGCLLGVNDGISSNGYLECVWQFPVRMRAEPGTVITFNPMAADAKFATGENATVGSGSTNDRHAYLYSTSTTASKTGNIHATADARL